MPRQMACRQPHVDLPAAEGAAREQLAGMGGWRQSAAMPQILSFWGFASSATSHPRAAKRESHFFAALYVVTCRDSSRPSRFIFL